MSFFFFNDTAPTEIYTLSLHDALPISSRADRLTTPTCRSVAAGTVDDAVAGVLLDALTPEQVARSEEHTSELQSHLNLVCRLLLEKKKYLRQHDHLPVRHSHTCVPRY